MATSFCFRSGGCLSPAPSLFEVLTPAVRCQKLTARVRVDGRRELAPGGQSAAELASLAEGYGT
jgi:hypothetical protein